MATLLTANPSRFSVNDNPTITYSTPYGESLTSLQACIAYISDGTEIRACEYRKISKTSGSYTFKLTDAEKENFFNSLTQENAENGTNTINVFIHLKAGLPNGKTQFSTLAREFVFAPWITATVVDTNPDTIALTDDSNKIIKGYSWAKATMSAKARKGAAIDESLYVIRNGDNDAYNKSHTFTRPDVGGFKFIASDSWGDAGSATVYPPMVDYFRPTNNIKCERPDALGNMTVACSGNWYNGSFGAVNNTITVQCRYATSGGLFNDDWIDMGVSFSGNSYYATANFKIADYVHGQFYVFETRVKDKLDSANDTSDAISSTPVFHWGENDFVFEVPVAFNAGIVDDFKVESGEWTPYLRSDAIHSYVTQRGWYIKHKRMVTVGFFLKANCNAGYDGVVISIYGLPFLPLISAAGGGMCSGAYISGGHNFQCFVAEPIGSGTITTRVQACNNTSASNLNTSASGCYYRSSGGEITLSGTITYMMGY